MGDGKKTDFETAGDDEQLSLPAEFWLFLRQNKKWWMLPILISLGLLALFAALAVTGAAPFIYTFF